MRGPEVPDQPPWSPAVAEVLRAWLPAATARIVQAVSEEVPAYSGSISAPDQPFGETVRTGVEQALEHFVALVEDPEAAHDPDWRTVIVELGRSVVRAGRTLEALLAAYRVGARHAWREVSAAGSAAGVPPEELYRLAEELFLYIDELSGLSAEGYAAEQADQAGERQRLRRTLATLLLQHPPADPAAIAEASRAAAWPTPDAVAVLVLATDDPDRLAGRLGADALTTHADGIATIIVPDPEAPGRLATLRAAIQPADLSAALGPTVTIAETARSAERARMALGLSTDQILPGHGLLICDEHLLPLLLHRDEPLLADIRHTVLAPLDGLSERVRERLLETLRAFLDHEGRMDPAARALGVHPQTVRYRVAQLRELLGQTMEEPDQRLLLRLALRAPRKPLRTAATSGPARAP
jgi:hypothetical protein